MTGPMELIPAVDRAKYAAELPSEPLTIDHLAKFVRARNINPRTLARLLLVEAELEEARATIAALTQDPRPSDDQIVGGAAITAWLYVQASVESMERAMISAVKTKAAAIMAEMQRELRGPAPFGGLIAAAKQEGIKTDAN